VQNFVILIIRNLTLKCREKLGHSCGLITHFQTACYSSAVITLLLSRVTAANFPRNQMCYETYGTCSWAFWNILCCNTNSLHSL